MNLAVPSCIYWKKHFRSLPTNNKQISILFRQYQQFVLLRRIGYFIFLNSIDWFIALLVQAINLWFVFYVWLPLCAGHILFGSRPKKYAKKTCWPNSLSVDFSFLGYRVQSCFVFQSYGLPQSKASLGSPALLRSNSGQHFFCYRRIGFFNWNGSPEGWNYDKKQSRSMN